MRVRRALALVASLAIAGGLTLAGEQLWLAAKAQLAAQLIDRALARHLDDGGRHRPWAWADTVPLAELRVPRLGVRRVVLAGASGASLAFGPGHLDGTAVPNGEGNCAIAGHRDSWFRFLERLEGDDTVLLRTLEGTREWRVEGVEVVDRTSVSVLEPTPEPRLTLITCYPFDALTPGPLRYVVRLVPLSALAARGR